MKLTKTRALNRTPFVLALFPIFTSNIQAFRRIEVGFERSESFDSLVDKLLAVVGNELYKFLPHVSSALFNFVSFPMLIGSWKVDCNAWIRDHCQLVTCSVSRSLSLKSTFFQNLNVSIAHHGF